VAALPAWSGRALWLRTRLDVPLRRRAAPQAPGLFDFRIVNEDLEKAVLEVRGHFLWMLFCCGGG
jgi:hypothetical protein